MSFRNWLIILGVLAIVLIILYGCSRILLHRRRTNELNFGLEEIKWQDDEYSNELPNGGSRLVHHGKLDSEDDGGTAFDISPNKRLEPFISDFSESDPHKCENAAVTQPVDLHHDDDGNHNRNNDENDDGIVSGERIVRTGLPARKQVPEEQTLKRQDRQGFDPDQSVPVLMDIDDRSQDVDALPDMVAVKDKPLPKQAVETFSALDPESIEPEVSDLSQGTLKQVEEVLIINLIAKKGETFAGSDLFALFMSEKLRFGEMNIFHRYIQPNGSGDILFSVANGVEPGTFNLKTMEHDSTTALSFFMGLPGPEGSEPMQVFQIMVEAVYRIAGKLGGVLKDERHSVLTQQTLEHYRQRISDFERRRMAHRRNNKASV